MAAAVGTPKERKRLKPPGPNVKLVESDGVPLESFWHQVQIILLADVVNLRFDQRDDFFAGGNMFIYFNVEQARNRDFRGPAFFFVKGVKRLPVRKWWAVWDEGGRYPDLIIELLSESTAQEDRTTKKAIYEKTFRTPEYYCFDPDTKRLEGWRLNAKLRYQPLKRNDKGWLWSEELDCWLGTWDGAYAGVPGTWLRFFDKDGRLLPTHAEVAATEADRLKARVAELEKKSK
jgi:Uma2 family endonuclease